MSTNIAWALTIAAVMAGNAGAAERATPAEAKAMLDKAAAHYKAVGRTQALADFNAKKAPFGDRDLYVVCLDSNHIEVANGGFPSVVGTSADAVKDATGKPLGTRLWEVGSKGEGTVAYDWLSPVTKKTEHKVSFVRKVGDDVCVVGAYAAR